MTFARFIEWSPQEFSSASAPIVVGIIGDEAVAVALETIARGKNVAGRTMAVKRLQWDSEIVGVHMVFIGEPEKRRLRVVLDRIRSRQIVTRCPRLADFGRAGGMITLTVTDGRISFAVNSARPPSAGFVSVPFCSHTRPRSLTSRAVAAGDTACLLVHPHGS